MLSISTEQFASLTNETRVGFLLETVSDWFGLFGACYGRPSRLHFEAAFEIGDYLLGKLEGLPQPTTERVDYAFIHTVLTAAEMGATPDQLRAGVAGFCRALPADEAAFILFEFICAVAPADGIMSGGIS